MHAPGAEAGKHFGMTVNIMAAAALIPCVARLSAAMAE